MESDINCTFEGRNTLGNLTAITKTAGPQPTGLLATRLEQKQQQQQQQRLKYED
jgi:hypothetical protein